MSTVKILYVVSNVGMQAEALAGHAKPASREMLIDLIELSQQERDVIVALAGVNRDGNVEVVLRKTTESDFAEYVIREKPDSYGMDGRGTQPMHWVAKRGIEFDADPTIGEIIERINQVVGANKLQLQIAERLAQPYAEKYEVGKREREELQARHRAEYDRMRPIMGGLIEQGDYDALSTSNTGDAPVNRPDWYVWKWCEKWTERADSLDSIQDEALKSIREQREADAKKQREAVQDEWIIKNGSAHLRKCLEQGYNCQRLYVIQRASSEAAEYTVDYFECAEWQKRSGPSESALDELVAAQELGIGEPEIVWLTAPARDSKSDDLDDDEFDNCEAVVIHGYLGKYDLVKQM